MGRNTKIEWADHTINWWIGCEAVSPACAHCYAASWAKRVGRNFATRTLTTLANRTQALRFNAEADAFEAEHGHRQRIFVNSLSDWADNKAPNDWRENLFEVIRGTPRLDYLLLTKRIGNVRKMLPPDWGDGYPNVRIGASMVNQDELNRDIIKLLSVPARGGHFISAEPLLGPLDFERIVLAAQLPIDITSEKDPVADQWRRAGVKSVNLTMNGLRGAASLNLPAIDWIIVGGESGGGARPIAAKWVRSIRDQCARFGTKFFFKQWGEWAPPDQVAPEVLKRNVRQGSIDNDYVIRVGKHDAGRMLDQREHSAFPGGPIDETRQGSV